MYQLASPSDPFEHRVSPGKRRLIRGPKDGEDIPEILPILPFTDVLIDLYKGGTKFVKEQTILEKLEEKRELYKSVAGEESYQQDLAEVGCRSTDPNGWTVLHWAVQNDFLEVAKWVLELEKFINLNDAEQFGSPNNAMSPGGDSNYHYFSAADKYGQRCAQDEHGLTPVMLAVFLGHQDMLELLMNGDVSLGIAPLKDPSSSTCSFLYEIRNNYDCTVLHYAAMRDRCDMIPFLLSFLDSDEDKYMLLNAEDRAGETALHHACFHMFPRTIHALLNQPQTNGNLRNHVSKLPLDVALDRAEFAKSDFPSILKQLHEYHDKNLPELKSNEEIRQTIGQIARDETTKRYHKRQLRKKLMLLQEQQRQMEFEKSNFMMSGGMGGNGSKFAFYSEEDLHADEVDHFGDNGEEDVEDAVVTRGDGFWHPANDLHGRLGSKEETTLLNHEQATVEFDTTTTARGTSGGQHSAGMNGAERRAMNSGSAGTAKHKLGRVNKHGVAEY
ncbi:unnamed protein product [Amoebophrya sp. A120]|nr:unnamed protein product [Amoebophrya sp. A120]|eukprot:GSA120T00014382001.1